MGNTSHRWSVLVACFVFCALCGTAISAMAASELTLRLEPLKATVKEGEAIGMTMVFVGGAHETTLIMTMGADPSGMITYREWTAANRDPRSFAADRRRRIAAREKLEQHHHALDFKGPGSVMGNLPAGRYRIVVNTFRSENRTSRVLRSRPVEIVVTAR
jgi:hypothetical protein